MKKYFIVFVCIVSILSFGSIVSAAETAPAITFPVIELGGCASKDECKAYCDVSEHAEACISFAEKKGIKLPKEATQIKNALKKGPGDCSSQSECRSYCEDPAHQEECISFAEKNGLLKKPEIEKARKFMTETGPGGCKGVECRTYCDKPENQKECFEFAKKNGLISAEESKIAEKIAAEGGPGGCKTQSECKTFCENSDNADECLSFAETHSLINHDEAQKIRSLGVGTGPGGCKAKAECENYCKDQSHQEECLTFAEEHGFMTKTEVEKAKHFVNQTGPGGCKGEACRTYCEDPNHQEECLVFAEKNNLIPKEELAQAKKFIEAAKKAGPGGCVGAECRTYCATEDHREECFKFAKENNLINKTDEAAFQSALKLHETIQGSGGPGNCKTESDCRTYCTDAAHVEECVAFGAVHGGIKDADARRMIETFHNEVHGDNNNFGGPGENLDIQKQSLDKFEQFKNLEIQFRGNNSMMGGEMMNRDTGEVNQTNKQLPPNNTETFVRPGGCTSAESCMNYCREHMDECRTLRPSAEDVKRAAERAKQESQKQPLPPTQGNREPSTDSNQRPTEPKVREININPNARNITPEAYKTEYKNNMPYPDARSVPPKDPSQYNPTQTNHPYPPSEPQRMPPEFQRVPPPGTAPVGGSEMPHSEPMPAPKPTSFVPRLIYLLGNAFQAFFAI